MENSGCCLVWFRQDLRLIGNKALIEAAKQGPVIGLYLIDPGIEGAQKWGLFGRVCQNYRRCDILDNCI